MGVWCGVTTHVDGAEGSALGKETGVRKKEGHVAVRSAEKSGGGGTGREKGEE